MSKWSLGCLVLAFALAESYCSNLTRGADAPASQPGTPAGCLDPAARREKQKAMMADSAAHVEILRALPDGVNVIGGDEIAARADETVADIHLLPTGGRSMSIVNLDQPGEARRGRFLGEVILLLSQKKDWAQKLGLGPDDLEKLKTAMYSFQITSTKAIEQAIDAYILADAPAAKTNAEAALTNAVKDYHTTEVAAQKQYINGMRSVLSDAQQEKLDELFDQTVKAGATSTAPAK